MGFSLAPFLPASNLLFFVGTFIGERLLYMPSLGFSILLGEGLAQILVGALFGILHPPGGGPCSDTGG